MASLDSNLTGSVFDSDVRLYNLPFTPIDISDSSWTLLDPDSLVDTVAFTAGYNVVTWNALGVGSQDYNPGSGANLRAPRWYRLLKVASQQLVTDDLLIFQTRMENDEAVDDFDQSVVCGVCVDPTATVLATIQGSGGNYNAAAAANPNYGVWTINGVTSTGTALTTFGVSTHVYGALHVGSASFMTMNSAGQRTQNGSRNASTVLTTAQDLYEVVSFGTLGAVAITAGWQSSLKLASRHIVMVNP